MTPPTMGALECNDPVAARAPELGFVVEGTLRKLVVDPFEGDGMVAKARGEDVIFTDGAEDVDEVTATDCVEDSVTSIMCMECDVTATSFVSVYTSSVEDDVTYTDCVETNVIATSSVEDDVVATSSLENDIISISSVEDEVTSMTCVESDVTATMCEDVEGGANAASFPESVSSVGETSDNNVATDCKESGEEDDATDFSFLTETSSSVDKALCINCGAVCTVLETGRDIPCNNGRLLDRGSVDNAEVM
ncbi:hypothetical protein WOLCODRAFT_15145 [Wolfiporia cocos MD-104 SS10]|uniref:Uncharacterized protein n=1 Tax=Wolfiporia cocos (strain MD-104) TaxID=742152 RepID=A0A2H3J312_WOLCO|nr:hypothetical protein WOLCODRAFT_15145 [Wolfiporia cocos MD-104 SS10]